VSRDTIASLRDAAFIASGLFSRHALEGNEFAAESADGDEPADD
jgi:hypothetical protein